MKNILFVARTLYDNPFSRTRLQKLKRLAKEYCCYFFVISEKTFFKKYKFICRFYRLKNISWLFFDILGMFVVPYIVKQKNIDVLIFQSPYEFPIILICSLFYRDKVKIVVEMHGDMTNGLRFYGKSRLKCLIARIFTRFSLNLAHKIRLVSPYQLEKDKKLQKYREKIVIFPAFMNLDYFISRKENSKLYDVIFVGQLEKIKNIELVIDVISDFKMENKKVSLLIVGEGSLRSRLEKYAESKEVLENIIFTGKLEQRELREHYRKSRVLVLPSLHEGFGRVVCEAAACKIDVLFSENCGVRSYFPKKSCFKDKKELKEKLYDILFDDDYEYIDYNITHFIDDKHFFKGMKELPGLKG